MKDIKNFINEGRRGRCWQGLYFSDLVQDLEEWWSSPKSNLMNPYSRPSVNSYQLQGLIILDYFNSLQILFQKLPDNLQIIQRILKR